MHEKLLQYEALPIRGQAYGEGGLASLAVRRLLLEAGVEAELVRRVAVACYEAEMNIILHAQVGLLELELYRGRITIRVNDEGPGIEDVGLAMTPGWSAATEEARALGFGAGLGLPSIRDHADEMTLEGGPGAGVRLVLHFRRRRDA